MVCLMSKNFLRGGFVMNVFDAIQLPTTTRTSRDWTVDEMRLALGLRFLGNSPAKIAEHLPNRTETAVMSLIYTRIKKMPQDRLNEALGGMTDTEELKEFARNQLGQ